RFTPESGHSSVPFARIMKPDLVAAAFHTANETKPRGFGLAAYSFPSYLNESFNFARYSSTFPSLICASNFSTSPIRRPLQDLAGISTANLAASANDFLLVPINSMTLQTDSGITFSSCLAPQQAISLDLKLSVHLQNHSPLIQINRCHLVGGRQLWIISR